MADFDQQRLVAILANPTETLSIECKGWLNLSDKRNKATLAKAAIALANHGGGTIVLGIGKSNTQAGKLVCLQKPEDFQAFSSDDASSAINTYADPDIDFVLDYIMHPDLGVEYPFILIPGGMLQPVFAKKSYDGVITKGACYIRKPGPKSEKPSTAQEWRDVYNRCVWANRDNMLNAIRGIIDGRVDTNLDDSNSEEAHTRFLVESRERWREQSDSIPEVDLARLNNGHFEIAFSILGLEADLSLNELRNAMREAATLIPSIWFLFVDIDHSAQPVGNSMEAVYLNSNESVFSSGAFYYWRVRNDGRFYLVRSYQEDSTGDDSKLFYSLPIWRIGQALDYAAAICGLIGANLEFLFSASYAGLSGRELFDVDERASFWPPRKVSHSGMTELPLETNQFSPRQVKDNLAEIVFDLLTPLYTQFSFFELPKDKVSTEIHEMRKFVRSRSPID